MENLPGKVKCLFPQIQILFVTSFRFKRKKCSTSSCGSKITIPLDIDSFGHLFILLTKPKRQWLFYSAQFEAE